MYYISDIEKKIMLQLAEIYNKISNSFPEENNFYVSDVNLNTFSAHGTNGMALFLGFITGKQLLPSQEREQKGIPTITGEAKYKKKQGVTHYHQEWQNFVSSLDVHNKDPNLDLVLHYSQTASKEFSNLYSIFENKLHKILKKKFEHDLLPIFEQTNKEELKKVYEKLSNMDVIIFGDGIGYAEQVHSMPQEYKYEKINIRAVVVPDEHKDFVQELLNVIKVQEVPLITKQEFYHLMDLREQYLNKSICFIKSFAKEFSSFNIEDIPHNEDLKQYAKIYGYNSINFIEKFGSIKLEDFRKDWNNYPKRPHFTEDFVDVFSEKIPWHYYFSEKKFTVDRVKKYKNADKSFTEKIIPITYYNPPECNEKQLQSLILSDLISNNTAEIMGHKVPETPDCF